MAALPTGTVTFLFTDIEGSTMLLQRLGDRRYAEVLAEHQRLLREVFAKGNGHEVDTQGDAFLVVFSRAKEALATAVEAQRSLRTHPWPDGASLQVRMGLHTGEPIANPDRYVGLDVHRAARIGAAAHGGQILVSDATHGLVAKDLPDRVGLRDLGEHRVKDLAHPQHLFQVLAPDLREDFPQVRSLDAHRHNLPIQLTSFIGREKEIVEVRRLLGPGRLVTLTGSGGAGKTRLALQAAADAVEDYPDGVWLVELAPLADAVFVPSGVAAALDIPEQPTRPLTDTIADYLRTKTLLIVLDNCEHLRAPCQRLVDHLLRTSAIVRILATSREPLGVGGEITYRVPPLRLPDIRQATPVAQLAQYDAIRLFAERAALVQPGFTVVASNAPPILQICQRLDGMPLAIEFAAARVAALSVEQIAARLDDRFRLLTAGPKQTPPRHQTLRATLDWSHDLLTEHEQTLFRGLSVFAGGFTLEAAERVCAGTGIVEHDILDLVTRLVDKSLVVFEERDGTARYRLLDSVRQYGRERLEESGEADEVSRRHRDWYLDVAERANAKLRGPEQELWLSHLETEHDNLRAALAWSKAVRDMVAWLRLTGALTWFWYMNGHWGEGRRWVEDALSAGGAAESLVFWARWGAIMFSVVQGDFKRLRELTEDLSVTPEGMNEKEFSIMVGIAKGLLAVGVGGLERGVVLLEEAVAFAHELGDQWLLAFALAQLSGGVRTQGHHERAAGLCVESARLCEELGDRWRLSVALRDMGITLLCHGDYDNAATSYAKSLRLRAPAQSRWIVFQCLEGLACIACAQGRYERAAILFGAAEPIQRSPQSHREADFLAQVEHYTGRAQTSLGAQAFEAAQNKGRTMTLEQAIEYALQEAQSVG